MFHRWCRICPKQNAQSNPRGGQHLGAASSYKAKKAFPVQISYSDGQCEPHTEDRWDDSPRQVPHQGAGSIGNKPQSTRQESSGSANQGRKQGEHNTFVPTCFLCGKNGHKRPDCPTKWKVGLVGNNQEHDPIVQDKVVFNKAAVSLVVVPVRQQCLYVPGKIGNVECQMGVDTGAGQAIVDAKLVKPSEHLGAHMTLTMVDGSTILKPLAQVWITFGNSQIHHVVAVAEKCPEEGLDIGFLDYLLQLAKDNNKETMSMEVNDRVAEKVSVTRVQTANELAEERDDIILNDESGAFPFTFSDDLFSSDACIEQEVHILPNVLIIDLPHPTLCTDTADIKAGISDREKGGKEKVWNTKDTSVLNLVVVGEEVEWPQVDGVKLTMPTLDQTQQFEVENMLEQYGEVVCAKLGRAKDICHTINMGMSQPLRICPYRLALAWKDQLRMKFALL